MLVENAVSEWRCSSLSEMLSRVNMWWRGPVLWFISLSWGHHTGEGMRVDTPAESLFCVLFLLNDWIKTHVCYLHIYKLRMSGAAWSSLTVCECSQSDLLEKADSRQCVHFALWFTFAPRVKEQVEPNFVGPLNNASVWWHHQHSQTVLANDSVRWTVQSQQHFILRSLLVKPPLVPGPTLLLNLDHHLVSLTCRNIKKSLYN